MSAIKKLMVFVLVTAVVIVLERAWLNAIQPGVSKQLAIAQVNGDNAALRDLRLFEDYKDAANIVTVFVTLCAAWLLASRPGFGARRPRIEILLGLTLVPFMFSGCVRPYDRPEYAEIDTSETGFLIPLEGDSGVQAKFQSEEYLRALKVAAKRVQITHRWSQEGRLPNSGQWIPLVRLIKVNRSPVTREWTADTASGTASKNQAIWIESADSIGFSMGFTCTSFIPEEQAARYRLDVLREKKQEISDAVKKDITDFFAQRGVVITTVGMFGGMTYENGEIQKSIDNTVIAQQLKVVNQARFEAQQRDNDRVELEASAIAERARRIAAGEADAKKIAAFAEAQSIREVNKALAEARQNPLLYQLRALEVERARVDHWNGQYPAYFVGTTGGQSPNLLLQMPPMPR